MQLHKAHLLTSVKPEGCIPKQVKQNQASIVRNPKAPVRDHKCSYSPRYSALKKKKEHLMHHLTLQ